MPQKLHFDDADRIAELLPETIKKQKLSILLPVYNEESFIAENIRFIAKLLRSWHWNFEIIASNDGSQDQSRKKILSVARDVPELLLVDSPRNFGKGRALASAYEASSGTYILFLDSDLELPAEHIPFFFARMLAENADAVIGSKKDPRSDLYYPAARRVFSTAYFMGVKLLFGLPVQDTQTGIKLFKRAALEKSLPYLLVKRFAFDIELLVLCHSQGAKICSHPVVVRYIRDGIGRMGLNTIVHMFKDTLAVFWRLRTRVWKHLPSGKSSFKYAVVTLGPAESFMGDVFRIGSLAELPALMPKLLLYDLAVFLHEGSEIAPFMEHALGRLFHSPSVRAAVPLLYNKEEQGAPARRYYTLANAFYPVGSYARFRPTRAHILKESFPLSACTLRVSYLKELLEHTPGAEALRVPKPHYSPFFFIHSSWTKDLWARIHREEPRRDLYKTQAWTFSVFAIMAFVSGLSVLGINFVLAVLLMSVLPFLELTLYLWFNFSLGLRRGTPFYCYFVARRLQALSHLG